jgi:hypothetical protein
MHLANQNERSWTYWHYRLGLSAVDHVPPLPVRRQSPVEDRFA